MRRAQSIGVNVVIIAAIALLVLVIIALIVSGGARNLTEGTKSCEANGGRCAAFSPGPDWVEDQSYGCSDGEVCYVYQFG